MEWISINKKLPVVAEGKHGVEVLCSVHDPVYEEMSNGNGSDTQTAIWDGEKFKTLGCGGNGGWGFYQITDIITHWMYMPKPFQVTDTGFTFDSKDLLEN